jgi:hypothetical protein
MMKGEAAEQHVIMTANNILNLCREGAFHILRCREYDDIRISSQLRTGDSSDNPYIAWMQAGIAVH